MVDDCRVENIIFLVKENESVAEFYPKLDGIFKMQTLEIDLDSSEKPNKNILILTFNLLNKTRKSARQVKMFKTNAWKDSDQYPSVQILCYILDKTMERNSAPTLIIGSKTIGLPVCGVMSVCLNVTKATKSDNLFNVLENAMAVKKTGNSFFQNCMLRFGKVVPGSIKRGVIKGTNIENGSRYIDILDCEAVLPNRTLLGRFEVRLFADNNRTPCIYCHITGHPSYRCKIKPSLMNQRRCYNCSGIGHLANACKNEAYCSYCNIKGHAKIDCE
ncbi:CNBP [Mytilus coruscus]|uniref:CNBP n=1 Tax=Mytilus coruscus TaxID=42192 RepID=A0A6J8AHK4_MYTCO|nr:CNBP [Mytilus coruscus]